MKRYIILLAALTLSIGASAQVSGYMGRKFSIMVDASPSILYNPNADDFDFIKENLMSFLTIGPSLTLDYVLPDNTSIMARASVHRHDSVWKVSPYTNYTFMLGARKYTNLAPLGTYYGGGLVMNYLKFDEPNDLKNILWGADFELGRNYIFFDYLIMNIGVRYGVTLAQPIDWWFGGQRIDRKQQNVNAAVWLDNLMLLEIGIGLLPF